MTCNSHKPRYVHLFDVLFDSGQEITCDCPFAIVCGMGSSADSQIVHVVPNYNAGNEAWVVPGGFPGLPYLGQLQQHVGPLVLNWTFPGFGVVVVTESNIRPNIRFSEI